ncbi:ferritin family protein [archaeon]
MASMEVTKYALRDLYRHEVMMLESYTAQLAEMPPGKAKDLIQRIHGDEIKHCEVFKKLLQQFDPGLKPSGPVKPRSWNFDKELREAIEWDQQMEEKLEGVYIEQLGNADLTDEVKEAIEEVMRETHAHSELLKVLLLDM